MKTCIRLHMKLALARFFLLDSFCKYCGRTVHDFIVPDDIWAKVRPLIQYGDVLCYDCFCEKCGMLGLPTVWQLEAACPC